MVKARPSPGIHLLVATVLVSASTGFVLAREPSALHVYPHNTSLSRERTYICADTDDLDAILGYRRELMRAGAHSVNLILPDRIIVCRMPSVGALPALPPGFVRLESGDASRAPARFQPSVDWIRGAYRKIDEYRAAKPSGDAAVRPRVDIEANTRAQVREIERQLRDAGITPSARTVEQNSEILAGDVLIQVVIPEVQQFGDWNIWQPGDLLFAKQALLSAFGDLQSRFKDSSLSAVFRFRELIPTTYNPVEHSPQDSEGWIRDVTCKVSYCDPSWNAATAVHHYNTTGREALGTDWVFTAFIINARRSFGRFPVGSPRAYSKLGGPYMVLSYPAAEDVFEIGESNLYTTYAEKLYASIFWAMDENPAREGPTCDDRSGYLAYKNGNITALIQGFAVRCNERLDCIMIDRVFGDNARPMCFWTQGHVGVIDADNNLIPDALDTQPVIEFASAGHETTETADAAVVLTGISKAIPNQNPFQEDGERNDYAPPLVAGTVSFGGTLTFDLFPGDGQWDDSRETCTARLNGLPKGLTRVFFRIQNGVGTWSRVIEKRVYRLGLNYTAFGVKAENGRNVVRWTTLGETFGARFDVYRRAGTGGPYELISSGVMPESVEESFQHFRFVDENVEPGEDYAYYVDGEFDVTVNNQPRRYNEQSDRGEVRGIVHLTGGALASVGPNPFTSDINVSVRLRKAIEDDPEAAPGVAVTPPLTPVDVSIYDVRGRLVRVLIHEEDVKEVVTVNWDGRDRRGQPVANGIYFARVRAGARETIKKLIRLR